MIELRDQQFSEVLPLYSEAGIGFPLIRAVVRKRQAGRIWVDRKDAPQNALVLNKFGFTHLFGDKRNEAFYSEIEKLIFGESSLQCKYLLWYSPPTTWCKKMDSMADEIARRRERIQLDFNPEKFREFRAEKGRIGKGFILKRLDEGLIEKCDVFNLDIENRFWGSAEDFLANGFGFCVLKDKVMVSICYSACVVDGVSEIDAATLEEYRGMNLASYAGAAFVEHCIENDIRPNWDCFDYNTPSLKLAKRLGFEERRRYAFYSVNRLFD